MQRRYAKEVCKGGMQGRYASEVCRGAMQGRYAGGDCKVGKQRCDARKACRGLMSCSSLANTSQPLM